MSTSDRVSVKCCPKKHHLFFFLVADTESRFEEDLFLAYEPKQGKMKNVTSLCARSLS